MELRQYLQILISRWWVILPVTFIALTGAFLFSYQQTPIYESTSTYVTTLDTDVTTDRDTTIYALDTMTGRQRLFVTYCEIMISGAVRSLALQMLNIDADAEFMTKYKVFCSNLPETNVLLLTVQGPAPALVRNLNEAIGISGMAHANQLYRFFPLEKLDAPYLLEDPISPKYMQNGVLGGAFGLVLGISTALLMEYLKRPSDRLAGLSIRNQQVGIFNQHYFQRRFQEELERASIHSRPISMAVLRLYSDEDFVLIPEVAQNTLIRKLALTLEENLPRGHMIAYLQPLTFGLLLIETPSEEAARIIASLQTLIREHPFTIEGGFQANFTSRAGVVSSSGNLKSYKELEGAAFEAMNLASREKGKNLHLIHATPRPFLTTQEMLALEAMSLEPDHDPLAGYEIIELDMPLDLPSAADFALDSDDAQASIPIEEEDADIPRRGGRLRRTPKEKNSVFTED